jgi:site-specific DNA recombinase
VVGEFERAFCRDQFVKMLPWFARHGVAVWLPEASGPINLDNPVHQALVLMLDVLALWAEGWRPTPF